MATRCSSHGRTFIRSQIASGFGVLVVALTATVFNATARATDKAAQTEAQRLVAAAAQAEIAGDTPKHQSLLNDAVKSDPENPLARWQLGQVQLYGKWLPVKDAERLAAIDPLQFEYLKMCDAAGLNVQAQIVLSRWCRDNHLNEEANLHWAVVLSLDPKNKEALRALDMVWKDGRLVNREETAQQKRQAQIAKDAAKKWEPIIAKWRRAVAGRDIHEHDAALVEIRAVEQLDAIPSIETVSLGRDANDLKHAEECLQISVAFLYALEKMPAQVATVSLVRHAVFSPGNKARARATAILKSRNQQDYIPLLLGGLAMPIESSFNLATDAEGSVHYSHALYREGPDSDWSYDLRKRTAQQDFGGTSAYLDFNTGKVGIAASESPFVVAQKKAIVAAAAQNSYGKKATATEAQVARANEEADELNSRIIPVLVGTTGKDYGDNPKQWWAWWRNQNEYYASDHPVEQHYQSETDHFYYGYPKYQLLGSPPYASRSHSCFAKGTPVWTKTGQKAIEAVQLGELVLSQDIDTGELKYKPVLATTVRPPSPMLNFTVGSEHIVSTLGHPFWVSGVGWRMAKELGEDANLHGVTGSARIRAIESAPEAEAYNLVVADFNTYFVGESGLLVHDNLPRRSTLAVLPGLQGQQQ